MAKVLYLASEMVPYCKTGGLADVAGAFPKALKNMGHDVKTVLPYYHFIKEEMKPYEKFHIHISSQAVDGMFLRNNSNDGVDRYFVYNPYYYDRNGIYGDDHGDFGDNDERFTYFCEAALLLCKIQNWQPDIVHLNDWQTGILASILKLKYADDPFFKNTKIVFTIHNLAYQGYVASDAYKKFDLPPSIMNFDGMEINGAASLLKAGLQYSDFITTVSPTYAKEIQTTEFGCGMEDVLRANNYRLAGILNGVDDDEWNPLTDQFLGEYQFGPENLEIKESLKRKFLSELGLPYWSHVPLIGMVCRFTPQKGIQLIEAALEEILHQGTQVVILGSGDSNFASFLKNLEQKYPKQLKTFVTFSNELSHQIEAASDYFLMPSRYEPCGLNQMYSLKYGTIPIVYNTGGLADTVFDCDKHPDRGNGYVFYEYNRGSFMDAVKRALGLYQYKDIFKIVRQRGMTTDFSWYKSAETYGKLYDYLCFGH
ncbi:MAG: glycogen synthase GlgA [Candidatus Cloacimonadota bacterium]|nr:MAG: glycogen synthase GlgA [Candidatus Cloacimonadota bacterium]